MSSTTVNKILTRKEPKIIREERENNVSARMEEGVQSEDGKGRAQNPRSTEVLIC